MLLKRLRNFQERNLSINLCCHCTMLIGMKMERCLQYLLKSTLTCYDFARLYRAMLVQMMKPSLLHTPNLLEIICTISTTAVSALTTVGFLTLGLFWTQLIENFPRQSQVLEGLVNSQYSWSRVLLQDACDLYYITKKWYVHSQW
jgi:hypothetical protein